MTAAELIEAIQLAAGFRDLRNIEMLYDDAEWGASEILGVEFVPEGGSNPRDAIVVGSFVVVGEGNSVALRPAWGPRQKDIAGDKENR